MKNFKLFLTPAFLYVALSLFSTEALANKAQICYIDGRIDGAWKHHGCGETSNYKKACGALSHIRKQRSLEYNFRRGELKKKCNKFKRQRKKIRDEYERGRKDGLKSGKGPRSYK